MKRAVSKPRKPMPSKFMYIDGYGYGKGASSEAGCVEKTSQMLNNPNNARDHYGIYRLVKVCRRKFAPIEIEDISVPCSEK